MSTTLLSAVGATGASTAKATGTRSSVLINVRSASTSSATVKIQQSIDGLSTDVGWYTVATITNPTSVGELWAGPAAPYTRVNVTAWASGAITAVEDEKLILGDPLGQEWRKLDQAAEAFGAVSASSLTASSLTAGRVPYVGTAGLLVDEAALAYDAGTNTLTAGTFAGAFDGSTVTASSLTATRIPIIGASGLLEDSSALTAVAGAVTGTSFTGALIGTQQDTVAAKAGDGAISAAAGTIYITKGSALGSSTLATSATNGLILRIVSTTAYAHVVSVASGKVNGGSNTTITFTSGAIGDSVTLIQIGTVWYTIGTTGTITVT